MAARLAVPEHAKRGRRESVCAASDGAATGSEHTYDVEGEDLLAARHPGWTRQEVRKWQRMNEQFVDDVHLEFFYKPHSVLLMVGLVSTLVYLAMNEPAAGEDTYHKVMNGLFACVAVFLVFSLVALPNGPFVRPHPAVWRCVLGVSILYWLVLVFVLFQTRSSVRQGIVWLSNEVNIPYTSPEDDPAYASDCAFTFSNIMSRVDFFCFAHFAGWVGKALMLRSVSLCCLISITWEVTEVIFSSILPNFAECWWDQMIFDILLCNGVGILVGSRVNRILECRDYNWEAVTDVPTLRGKVKRAALQFTPSDWTVVQWEPFSSRRRMGSTALVCLFVLLTELSTFLLKHVLSIPTKHMFVTVRLVIWWSFGLPSLRQFYIFVTDKHVKRLGTQSWVACGVLATELLICVKFGKDFFDGRKTLQVVGVWFAVIVFFIFIWLLFAEVCVCVPCVLRLIPPPCPPPAGLEQEACQACWQDQLMRRQTGGVHSTRRNAWGCARCFYLRSCTPFAPPPSDRKQCLSRFLSATTTTTTPLPPRQIHCLHGFSPFPH